MVFKRKIKTKLVRILEQISPDWRYYYVLYTANLRGLKPIAIYQMGKVGSTTIYQTVKSKLRNPVFHIHFLRPENISKIQDRYRAAGIHTKAGHLAESIFLTKFYWKDAFLKWNIITLVRDPITSKLSHLFHNPKVHHSYLFDEQGNVDKKRALNVAHKSLMDFNEDTDYACNWLNDELQHFLKINPLDYPFDKFNGYTIIKGSKQNILIMQMESIDKCLGKALIEMGLATKNIEIIRSNENVQKEFSSLYKYVNDNLKLPKSKVSEIYNSRYGRHFYSNVHIENQIERWSQSSKD